MSGRTITPNNISEELVKGKVFDIEVEGALLCVRNTPARNRLMLFFKTNNYVFTKEGFLKLSLALASIATKMPDAEDDELERSIESTTYIDDTFVIPGGVIRVGDSVSRTTYDENDNVTGSETIGYVSSRRPLAVREYRVGLSPRPNISDPIEDDEDALTHRNEGYRGVEF